MSTKAQLIAHIASLQATHSALQAKNEALSAMFEQERTSHDGAIAHIEALEAKLVVARTCYRELRDSIHHTDAPATKSVAPTPVVTQFKDALGRVWIKTRIGNKASSRLAA